MLYINWKPKFNATSKVYFRYKMESIAFSIAFNDIPILYYDGILNSIELVYSSYTVSIP